MALDRRFAFGRNWREYVERHLSEERVEIARRHILDFLGSEDVKGKSFLDIGSGSGINSLAALRAGASRVVSFDYDPEAVAATAMVKLLEGNPSRWTVMHGSAIDPEFMRSLGQFDVVYAWGVLHHTGDQWLAFRLAAERVAPRGSFYVAMYTSDVFLPPHDADFWLGIKRRHVEGNTWVRRKLEYWYAWEVLSERYRAGVMPWTYIRDYRQSRGMSFWTDVKDWVGGWPMQFSSIDEVKRLANELSLALVNIKTGHANTEYLFRQLFKREDVSNYARNWESHSSRAFIEQIKRRSMLHCETLSLLDYFASRSQGAILEIGSYTGSATVVMANAMMKAGSTAPLIAVERGGALDHDELPSKDIIGDLLKTISEFGVSDKVRIVEGSSGEDDVTSLVKRELGDQKIGMLFLDADGNISRDLSLYRSLLADGAIIVFDDYSGEADWKTVQVKPWVDEAIRTGIVHDLGVYPWGTWFGQYRHGM
jgi:predicted O-methyltransferase YrrM